MSSLISTEELASLSQVAESLFNSRIEIYHQHEEDQSTSWDDSVEQEIVDGSTPDEVVSGWFRNQPDYQTSDDLSVLAHEEDGRLFVPVGTTLTRTDRVVVFALDADGETVGDGTAYRVIDTNVENTWKVVLRASLRRIA